MNSVSPGVIALFQPNKHYAGHEAYLYALAEAMRPEYEAIVEAGFLLQLDSPDLGLGRHMMFKGQPDTEYRRAVDPDITYAKLATMAEGAAIASKRLRPAS